VRSFSPAFYAEILHYMGVSDVVRLNEPRYHLRALQGPSRHGALEHLHLAAFNGICSMLKQYFSTAHRASLHIGGQECPNNSGRCWKQ
jgi:hypothetical protein